ASVDERQVLLSVVVEAKWRGGLRCAARHRHLRVRKCLFSRDVHALPPLSGGEPQVSGSPPGAEIGSWDGSYSRGGCPPQASRLVAPQPPELGRRPSWGRRGAVRGLGQAGPRPPGRRGPPPLTSSAL